MKPRQYKIVKVLVTDGGHVLRLHVPHFSTRPAGPDMLVAWLSLGQRWKIEDTFRCQWNDPKIQAATPDGRQVRLRLLPEATRTVW